MKFLPNIGLSAMLNALSPVSRPVEAPEPELPPLDLSQLRNLPRDPDRSGTPESRPQRRTTYPPPVPFNYPNV